jgi:EAL domain-containing protein (putative c-di-GMP-specific phosphodiesterase class I)
VLARLGGDEFALLLPGAGALRALRVAAQIRELLTDTFVLDGETVHVDVSVGVACAPDAGSTRSELLRCADVAMYQAKSAHSFVRAYTAVGAVDGGQRLRTVEDLRQVLTGEHTRGGRLIVYLQPQIRLTSGRVVGAEALLRWAHPTRGLLTPSAFLSVAEAAGLMGRVTDVALEQALAVCRLWWDAGHHLPVSVNVTAASVHDNTLPQTISTALDRHGLPPRALVIELTEDTLMTDPPTARRVLDQVRRLGIGVSIDDYGTGYSSLAYLRNLAVDELKIDRAFTSGVADDPAAAAIVRHTADLAHSLGLRLVAEGVEDQMTMQILTALGCDLAQGFQIAQPMPSRAFLSWLGQHGEDALPPPTARAVSRQEAAN